MVELYHPTGGAFHRQLGKVLSRQLFQAQLSFLWRHCSSCTGRSCYGSSAGLRLEEEILQGEEKEKEVVTGLSFKKLEHGGKRMNENPIQMELQ